MAGIIHQEEKVFQIQLVKINSLKCKKFTLGGCFIEKINETVFITREN